MKPYLLSLCLLLKFGLSAQETLLFDDVQQQTLLYRYTQLSGSSAPVLRQILSTLQPQQTHTASFRLQYTYELQLLESNNALQGQLRWTEVQPTGEPQPGGFYFADLLTPQRVVYNLELVANDEVVNTTCVRQNLSGQLPVHDFAHATVTPNTYYSLRVKDLYFEYGGANVTAVSQRAHSVQDYYDAVDQLQQLQQNLTDGLPDAPTTRELTVIDQRLQEAQQTLHRINNLQLPQQLPLAEYDPASFLPLLVATEDQYQARVQWLADLRNNIHLLYFDEGLAAYETGQLAAARTAFCAALNHKSTHAPSHFFVAQLDFETGQIGLAAERIHKLLNNYQPDATTLSNARTLASSIVRLYLNDGQTALALGDYAAALLHYQTALDYSQSLPGFDFGVAEAINRIREVHHLEFHDMVANVSAARANGQYAEALQLLETARVYQEEFQVNSQADLYAMARDLVQQLYQQQLQTTRELRYASRWQEALQQLEQTETLLRNYPGMISNTTALASEREAVLSGQFNALLTSAEDKLAQQKLDAALQDVATAQAFVQQYQRPSSEVKRASNLEARIQQRRYDRFVSGAQRARQQLSFADALAQYDQAQALMTAHAYLTPKPGIAQQIQQTALAQAEALTATALQQHPYNNDALATTLSEVSRLADRYRIMEHADLQTQLASLTSQRCQNAHELLYPKLATQLSEQQMASDYIAAHTTLADLEELLIDYPDCALDNSLVQNEKTSIEHCAAYQIALNQANQAESNRQYREAIRAYQQAEQAYAHPSVPVRLRPHQALRLYEYVSAHEDQRMWQAGAHHFLDIREHERALTLLQQTIQAGVATRDTRALQTRMGGALAALHHAPGENWKMSYYTLIDRSERKAYRDMTRAFRKQWRRIE